MITITEPETATADEEMPPPIGESLLKTADTLRRRVAVQALIDEKTLLTHGSVYQVLVWKREDGTLDCAWDRLARRFYSLDLDDEERAFLDLVLSIVCPYQTSLVRIVDCGERRTAIILRSMIALSGCDTLAVGTRT
ncbi:hypothetical protein ACFWBR_35090 [Streptomyces sp. NPDC060006]|uniref:hypothetical protein n=1 Tax=unclassified Streptomyces TaxID=2593676 RepID=UPI0036B40639